MLGRVLPVSPLGISHFFLVCVEGFDGVHDFTIIASPISRGPGVC